MQEKIYHPELDDDETPSNIIDVKDSEVKAERFLSQEEMMKQEEKRRIAAERQRNQGGESSRQRALMQMMGGKLEDRYCFSN